MQTDTAPDRPAADQAPEAIDQAAIDARLDLMRRRLRQLRKDRGWRQADVSELTGFVQSYIGMIERGQKTPSLDTLMALAQVHGVDVTDLLAPDDGSQAGAGSGAGPAEVPTADAA